MADTKYIEMKNIVTGEIVTLVESTYVDKLGFWTTARWIRNSMGEMIPLWQYKAAEQLVAV